ncbi:hypothetical protein [Novosphingobium album (ex Hu et al. 2023)]|uniref:SRPBCC domain-containing protein n=1 Tax=Novosphingobium album (ex Hu et al. 2023) TaxID=2930093 RepID=A0ABT0B0Q0_9SPHN|nr:hypothetical protein [Novosphingobium album (ex Hu et al. 2023)]MCJ2178585.1 hypothetical protein [Novosphingobium album (ex Hu et al. 2023)]
MACAVAVTVIFVTGFSPTYADGKSTPRPDPQTWDLIAFEVKSWGRGISSWRIGTDGAGNWAESTDTAGEQTADTRTVYHVIEAGPDGFEQIRIILSHLPDPALDANSCRQFIPDMAYGTIRFTKGATTTEIAWNSGCMDDDYRTFMEALKQADELMRQRGKAGRILRTE